MTSSVSASVATVDATLHPTETGLVNLDGRCAWILVHRLNGIYKDLVYSRMCVAIKKAIRYSKPIDGATNVSPHASVATAVLGRHLPATTRSTCADGCV
ncbi:hypothetical protein NP493_27g05006 [Ridgeia piscesae]|uniref:Uncharacterized protein n=1 Tax=Ridgeia piscesae TaxID=27915 RepID=A0AAD9UKJ2_RIDPI|nr:hypothetical protein NP493_27g05006 [Ridgeia piscesae]